MGDKLYVAANSFVYANAAIQWGTIFGWIQLGLGIIMTSVGIAYRIWKWYKDAKADGKITGDEVKQLIDENKDDVINVITDTKDLIDDINDSTKDIKK